MPRPASPERLGELPGEASISRPQRVELHHLRPEEHPRSRLILAPVFDLYLRLAREAARPKHL
jgi:hypothetical protein